MSKYIKAKDAIKILGVTPTTLRNWAKTGKIKYIRSAGGMRLYDISQFELSHKKNVCYCRVASKTQNDELEQQIRILQRQYPDYEIISDIASGTNLQRQGLQTILNYCYNNEIGNVVVTGRDRLAQFDFEFVKALIEKFGGNLIIFHEEKQYHSKEETIHEFNIVIDIFAEKINELTQFKLELKDDQILTSQH